MYAELHTLSNYSFLRGASHPQELVAQAAALGYQALALTDECSLSGVVKAHDAAKQHGIKLIIGAEFQLPQGVFVLLAPNRRAYGQISQLITLARRRDEKGSYQLRFSDMLTRLDETILLWRPASPEQLQMSYQVANDADVCEPSSRENVQSQIEQQAQAYYQAQLQQLMQQLKRAFSDRLYILMERQLLGSEAWRMQVWQMLAEQQQVACVAAGGVRMHHKQRRMLLDVLTCIGHGTELEKAGSLLSANAESSFKSLEELARRYPQAWLDNSINIANACDFSLDELKYEYPSEVIPTQMNASDYLEQEVKKGALKRFPQGVPESVAKQYHKELSLIKQMQYEYFFLTIYDIVQFAKQQHILHQGRGSAANSVVCYCLGITEVDPTKINMLFERFISKERNEPPDIDVDFEHERREEVIQYIYRKYGRDRAALAATIISYRFKSAMADVGKALGLDHQTVDRMVKQVDRRDASESWQQQLQQKQQVPAQGLGRYLLPLVEEILGFPRHLSQHVGGFIISAGPLSELVPIENAAMQDRTVIQWDKDDLESLGLLKVDVLALGMLTAIRKCFSLLGDEQQPFTMAQVQWEQAEVYQMLQRGDSIGVFQVESRAQTSMLPRLKPQNYYDLVVQIAIVRPGPIQGDMVHPYLRRRDGIESVSYPSAAVESVLSRTLGVPIFQEQVIELAMVAAGFSGGEADQLRRAMASWKRSGELQQFENKLLQGMAERGYSADFAAQIYRQIKGFGEYGFPESHSASFALLAYVSAYLKYHYPAAFCCSLLNSQPMGFYSPSQLIQDVKRHGVVVLPICANHSLWQHELVQWQGKAAIRLGFRLIKGCQQQSMQALITARPEGGFSCLDDLYQLGVNRHELELLASADAFKQLSGHRHQARWQLSAYQPSLPLFDDVEPNESDVTLAEPSVLESLKSDYHYTGVTLGTHPMALLRPKLGHCVSAVDIETCRHGQVVSVAGLVVGRQRPGTASGVTFVTLEDETGNINVIVWSATAKAQRQAYLVSKILKVTGVFETQSGVCHIIAGRLEDISDQLGPLNLSSRDFH
ncbi:error-prone DNA polymerase [Shewanella waksmanii]|uniref:error-prone DNA polymerase n=1 Tax=Shewanella waksmanii TaxID=213783 RepID=UPI00048F6C7A|nr:error-prone DNA polymerase [Shewanella waksmanii]